MNISDIVDEYYNKIYKICLFHLGDPQEAEDAVQQVFLKLTEKLHTFRSESHISTWVFRITVNTTKNILRRRRILQFVSIEDSWGFQMVNPQRNSNPASLMESEEQMDLQLKGLQTAIALLSYRERTAFYLFYYEKKKHKEIAIIMKTTIPAVESLLYKAKRKIKKQLIKGKYNNK